MATEKQCEANRKNAQLSTGPRTREGKETVRFNALKHGLRADAFELAEGEDPAEFDARLAGWNRVYAPTNQVESDLVRQAVVLSWKVDRAVRYENSALAERIHARVIACDCADDDAASLLQAAGLAFFDPSPEGEKLRRYQSTLRRDWSRTLAELAKLRGRPAKPKLNFGLDANESPSSSQTPDPMKNEGLTGSVGCTQPLSLKSFAANVLSTAQGPRDRDASTHRTGLSEQANRDDRRRTSDPAETAGRKSPTANSEVGPAAPNKANSAAPNKANSAAPNKAISARGARELDRFFAGGASGNARKTAWLDISIEKR